MFSRPSVLTASSMFAFGGYGACDVGELNHSRLQVLLGRIADDELTTLEERAAVRSEQTAHCS